MHPTSLPGPYGIGDLGTEACAFVDWLETAGFHFWQVLPLGPSGYGNSPYQCHSVFAGNPNLISPQLLVRDGLILPSEIDVPGTGSEKMRSAENGVDFGSVIPWKHALLKIAHLHFAERATSELRSEFKAYRRRNADWLDDFALFMALKEGYGGRSVVDWPRDALSPQHAAAAGLAEALSNDVSRWAFSQWLFFRQWHQLLTYAHSHSVQLIGDAPIFAAMDSADFWVNPELFCLDEVGRPSVVAGVPPDYFAPTGQLWGNPLYAWEEHKRSNYQWWIRRVKSLLQLVDLVRLDHFRGFAGYWQIPASAPTAETGRWVPGPAEDFLDALASGVDARSGGPDLPLVAEDLGVATPDVTRLMREYGLPGMRVLQFAFTGYQDDFLPHNYPQNCVAYTGTHDNDTSRGWFSAAAAPERNAAVAYLRSSESSIVRDMIEGIWRSAAALTVVPMQDILELGSEARMNFPGKAKGYWGWRMAPEALTASLASSLRALSAKWSRLVPTQAEPV